MISVILCAAGSGSRAGFSENKVLRELNGLPVLSYSLSAFGEADEILIPCREEDEARIGALLSPFPQARTVRGGKTREESVWNALKEVKGDIVLIHDAARPFVTAKIVNDCIESVQKYGSGVCSLPATDTTVLAKDGAVAAVPPRGMVPSPSRSAKGSFLPSRTRAASTPPTSPRPTSLRATAAIKNSPIPRTLPPASARASASTRTPSEKRRTTSRWRASGSLRRAGLSRTATATCSSTP